MFAERPDHLNPDDTTLAGNSPASLIIGGYDAAAFEQNDIAFTVDSDSSLVVDLRSLVVANSLIGTMSPPLDGNSISMVIDSTVSDLWLPAAICDSLAQALNLTLDPATGRYLIDPDSHEALLAASPQFTFTLAANESSAETMNIVLPYDAFDLQLLPPIYESAVPYFPIRETPEGSTSVLGRAFLQEAYIAVDWERGNFTLGQAATTEKAPTVIPILPPSGKSSRSLSTGGIAGVVVGGVAAMCILVAGWWFWRRSNKRKAQSGAPPLEPDEKTDLWEDSKNHPGELQGAEMRTHEEGPGELEEGVVGPHEAQSSELAELHGKPLKHQLMSAPVFEMDGGYRPQELDSRSSQK